MVSISACHADDPGSIPGRGVLSLVVVEYEYNLSLFYLRIGPVAQWIRHRSTEPEIVGSSPTRITYSVLESSPMELVCVTPVMLRASVV